MCVLVGMAGSETGINSATGQDVALFFDLGENTSPLCFQFPIYKEQLMVPGPQGVRRIN